MTILSCSRTSRRGLFTRQCGPLLDILTLPLKPPSRTRETTLHAARVAQAVKTPCFANLDEGDPSEIVSLADAVLRVPITSPVFNPLFYILPGQLTPYCTEVARSVGKPEAQRTKSVLLM